MNGCSINIVTLVMCEVLRFGKFSDWPKRKLEIKALRGLVVSSLESREKISALV